MDNELKKNLKIAIISAGIYLILSYIVSMVFDLQSYIVYGAIAILLVTFCCMQKKNYLILGISIPIIYNVIGIILGWFTADIAKIILAAIEQGVIMLIISKMVK